MLSMPRGTDPLAVHRAAREFAKVELADHKYVMVLHDHHANPHFHISARAESRHGKRLNPRKTDLHRRRETFAEKLRDQGIEVGDRGRRARGPRRRLRRWRSKRRPSKLGCTWAKRWRHQGTPRSASSYARSPHSSRRCRSSGRPVGRRVMLLWRRSLKRGRSVQIDSRDAGAPEFPHSCPLTDISVNFDTLAQSTTGSNEWQPRIRRPRSP
jgi:hypothetical protein